MTTIFETVSTTTLRHCYKQSSRRPTQNSVSEALGNFRKQMYAHRTNPVYVCKTTKVVAVSSQHTRKCTTKQHKQTF